MGKRSVSSEKYTFSAEEIKSFAGSWDPMPFHIDEDLAKSSPIGALFASGIHVIAASIKLSHSLKRDDIAAVAGLGWNDVRFMKPVFSGDVLHLTSEVIEKRESKSKSDRGIVTSKFTLINQRDEPVAEYKIATLVLKKREI